MKTLDRAYALDKLGLAAQDWGPCTGPESTHAEFSAAWRGTVDCPGETEILANQPMANPNAAIDAAIDRLERGQMLNRGVREYIMSGMVQHAATLGMTEPQLYTAQVGYRRLKDFDEQIKSLRVQRV